MHRTGSQQPCCWLRRIREFFSLCQAALRVRYNHPSHTHTNTHMVKSGQPINSTDCELLECAGYRKQVVPATGVFVKLRWSHICRDHALVPMPSWHTLANICRPCAVSSGDRKLCKALSPKKRSPWEPRKEARAKTVKLICSSDMQPPPSFINWPENRISQAYKASAVTGSFLYTNWQISAKKRWGVQNCVRRILTFEVWSMVGVS